MSWVHTRGGDPSDNLFPSCLGLYRLQQALWIVSLAMKPVKTKNQNWCNMFWEVHETRHCIVHHLQFPNILQAQPHSECMARSHSDGIKAWMTVIWSARSRKEHTSHSWWKALLPPGPPGTRPHPGSFWNCGLDPPGETATPFSTGHDSKPRSTLLLTKTIICLDQASASYPPPNTSLCPDNGPRIFDPNIFARNDGHKDGHWNGLISNQCGEGTCHFQLHHPIS